MFVRACVHLGLRAAPRFLIIYKSIHPLLGLMKVPLLLVGNSLNGQAGEKEHGCCIVNGAKRRAALRRHVHRQRDHQQQVVLVTEKGKKKKKIDREDKDPT